MSKVTLDRHPRRPDSKLYFTDSSGDVFIRIPPPTPGGIARYVRLKDGYSVRFGGFDALTPMLQGETITIEV